MHHDFGGMTVGDWEDVLDIYKMLKITQTNCETMLREFNQHDVVLSIGKTLDPNLEE